MSGDPPSLLAELFAQSPDCTASTASALQDVVQEYPEHAEVAFEAIHAALDRLVKDGGRVLELSNTIVVLTPQHPAIASQLQEPLSRLTAHEDTVTRQEAYRCLGALGAVEPVNTSHVVDIIAEGITDNAPQVQRTALWSLTKLGLAEPASLSSIQGQLVAKLDIRPGSESRTRKRTYAAEALAVSATGTADTLQDPSGRPLESSTPKPFAAWAIQSAAKEIDISSLNHGQVFFTTNPEVGHQIVEPLVTQLQQQAEGDDSRLAVASIFALGYIVPGNRELQDAFLFLNELINDKRSRKAHAANWILDRGPFGKTGDLPDDLSSSTAVELTVAAPSDSLITGNAVGLPYSAGEDLGIDGFQLSSSVQIEGADRTAATLQMRHPEDGVFVAGECCRQNFDVEIGESVTVKPAATQQAREIVLTLPEGVAVDEEVLRTDPVRTELEAQRFTTGDYLGLAVVVKSSAVKTMLRTDLSSHLGRLREDVESVVLPVRVEATTPDHATAIGVNTHIEFRRAAGVGTELNDRENLTDSERVVPIQYLSTLSANDEASLEALDLSTEEEALLREQAQ